MAKNDYAAPSLMEKIHGAKDDILRVLLGFLDSMGDFTGYLNEPIALAATITGETVRRAYPMPSQASEVKHSIFKMVQALDKAVQPPGSKTIDSKGIALLWQQTEQLLASTPRPAVAAHVTPADGPPALAAAAIRNDIAFIGNAFGLSSAQLAGACFQVLKRLCQNGASAIAPPNEKEKRAYVFIQAAGTLIEAAQSNPIPQEHLSSYKKPAMFARLGGAGGLLTEILAAQNLVVEKTRTPHWPTLAAKSGALLGMTLYSACTKEITVQKPYATFSDAQSYLEESNQILVSGLNKHSGNIGALKNIDKYNANASAGHDRIPYPKHTIAHMYMPHGYPAYEAFAAQKPLAMVAKEYLLNEWEKATACLMVVSNVAGFAEREASSGHLAIRLAMQEAVAWSRTKAPDFEKIMENAPPGIKKYMQRSKNAFNPGNANNLG